MTKFYPEYENPTMIYNAQNQYAVIPGGDLAAYLAAGWFAAPQGDIHTEPAPFDGEIVLTKAEPAKDTGKPKKSIIEKE